MKADSEKRTKRDDILEVASRLFYEQGYNQTGIQQILHEADAAKGTFYNFFKSKEALGVEWLKQRHVTWNGWLHEAIDAKTTPQAKLLAAFDFLGNWMSRCDFRGCAFLNTLGEMPVPGSPLRQQITTHKSELHELFLSLVNEHHAGLPKAKREQIAATLFILFEGTIVNLQNFREDWPLIAAKKQVQALL